MKFDEYMKVQTLADVERFLKLQDLRKRILSPGHHWEYEPYSNKFILAEDDPSEIFKRECFDLFQSPYDFTQQ